MADSGTSEIKRTEEESAQGNEKVDIYRGSADSNFVDEVVITKVE